MASVALKKDTTMPRAILIALGWNLMIALGSIFAASQIFGRDEFYNLGDIVQYFVSLLALIPAGVAIYACYLLLKGHSDGRFLTISLNYVGTILSAAYLLHLWDVYIGIDSFAYALRDNYGWLVVLMIAYALFWLAGRAGEDSPARRYLEQASLLVATLALIGFLFSANALAAGSHILGKYGELNTWLVTGVILIFAFVTYEMLHLGAYFGETTGQLEAWQGWMMLSPNIIGFGLFFAGPLLLSFYLSFTDASVGQVPNFIGLRNYFDIMSFQIKDVAPDQHPELALDFGFDTLDTFKWGGQRYVLGAKDVLFWVSLRNTLVFCLMLVPLSTIPALILALILNSKIPGVKFFRAIYFLPSVAAVVGTALIWRWLYDPTIGYFNFTISEIVKFLNSLGADITDPRISWLTQRSTMLFAIVLLAAWQVVGFNTVLFLAGLQGIPKILYEAAFVDGANRWQQFRNVTLPMLAPTTFFVIITTVITGLQVFNEPYALMPARPLPEGATTAVYYLYTRGFFRFDFGYASSVAWLLFGLIFTITLIQFRVSRNTAYED